MQACIVLTTENTFKVYDTKSSHVCQCSALPSFLCSFFVSAVFSQASPVTTTASQQTCTPVPSTKEAYAGIDAHLKIVLYFFYKPTLSFVPQYRRSCQMA